MQSKLRLGMLFLCLLACPSFAQESGQQPPPRSTREQPMTDEEDARDRLTREMAKKAAKERAAALKTDTDKLLKLSVESKAGGSCVISDLGHDESP